MNKRNIYKFKHIKWRIRTAIPYKSTPALLKLISDLGADFSSLISSQEPNFIQYTQNLFDKGQLPRLFELMLEPADTNPIRKLINKYWMKRYNLTPANVVEQMTDEDWRPIVSDFFIIGSQWIASWLHTTNLSGLTNLEQNSNTSGECLANAILNNLTMNIPKTNSGITPAMENTQSLKDSASAPN